MKTQALNMYALVSSESMHVTVMPVMSSGMVERAAEATVIIVSRLRVKRRKHPLLLLETPFVDFEAPILVDGVPKSRKNE